MISNVENAHRNRERGRNRSRPLERVRLFQNAQCTSHEVQAARDQRLDRLSLLQRLHEPSGCVERLLDAVDGRDVCRGVQSPPLFRKSILNREFLDILWVVLVVDKVWRRITLAA